MKSDSLQWVAPKNDHTGGGCKILILGKLVMMDGGVVLNSDPWKTSLEMNQSPGKLEFEY